jgi:hypothetical protein
MTISLATGTQVAIASTYGTQFTITAITNANPAVATLSASHGVIVGDIIEVTSGWDLITKRLFRVSVVATNDVTLEGLNTVSTTDFPVGAGAGTGREITAFTSITQIQSIATSGGDLNFADISTIVDRVQKQIPTTRSPQQINFVLFDDPALAGYIAALAASNANALTGMRIVFPDNSRVLANGYWSLNPTPTININAPITAQLGFSAAAPVTRYAT